MSRARELTMGSRPSRSKAVRPEFAALRRMTRMTTPDVADLKAQIDGCGAMTRMRFQEGVIYAEACARYLAITGETAGPSPGVY